MSLAVHVSLECLFVLNNAVILNLYDLFMCKVGAATNYANDGRSCKLHNEIYELMDCHRFNKISNWVFIWL